MTLQLLPWQQNCLDLYKQDVKRDFVLIAGTGTGKTTAASAMALHAFSTIKGGKQPLICVFCPYRSIKGGWKSTLERLGLYVATDPTQVAEDIDAIVSTYAGAAALLHNTFRLIEQRELIFVFDEFHHLEENNTWAAPFIDGQYNPRKRIFISGTPWREDGDLPESLVPYKDDEVVADFTHTYGENVNLDVSEGRNTVAVRFIPLDMTVDVEVRDDQDNFVTVDTVSTKDTSRSDSIAPFVRFDGFKHLLARPKLTELIDKGVDHLSQMRRSGGMSNAGGIIFVSGKKEGDAVRLYLQTYHGIDAVFVKSDDPLAHKQIDGFRKNSDEWIIAIDMIAEGTDIPRLKVAVDLSFKLTLLHIIQRWGRVLRLVRDKNGNAAVNADAIILFINHAQLGHVAKNIEDEIKRNKRESNGEGGDPPTAQTTRRAISEDGVFAQEIFKGKTLDDQVKELAMWLKEENYGGKCGAVGLQVAITMAEMFIATNTIPKEFLERGEGKRSEPPSEEVSKRVEFELAVDNYTRVINRIAFKFMVSQVGREKAFSAAQQLVNKHMGVPFFTAKNATLKAVKDREVAALEVEEMLSAMEPVAND